MKIRVLAFQPIGFAPLPADDAVGHYRYLDPKPIFGPIEMGSPPSYIDRFCNHARMAMLQPEQLRRWKQPHPQFVLLEGTTGTGKTLSIYLLRWKLAELVSELTGEPIDAPTALAWGLVNRVVPEEDVAAETRSLLAQATRGSATSKALGKQAFHRQVDLDLPAAYAYASEVMAAASQTEPAQEGLRSFLEKRPARFRD